MSVDITIQNALKKYGEHIIIPNLNVKIRKGEFFTLLGPSGCGKTTLLKMIAGFNSIEGGEFYFNDKKINNLEPAKRNIGMVFQNYALFPHLTVKKNVEFGLKNKNLPKEQIAARIEKFLSLMQIDHLADRLPDRLSGGQQQRVALARALCIEPDVLLMDEPLSNLDAKLRTEMRTVIKNIQHKVGITTIYVTHDQEEAMAVSDRIAVMNNGAIQHIGTPKDIYQRPANLFVATFIGRSNILTSNLTIKNNQAYICLFNHTMLLPSIKPSFKKEQDVIVCVRPEELLMQKKGSSGIKAIIDDCVFLGLNTHYFLRLEDGTHVESIQESSIDTIIPAGTEISLTINVQKVNVFTADGNCNIIDGACNDYNLASF